MNRIYFPGDFYNCKKNGLAIEYNKYIFKYKQDRYAVKQGCREDF